MKEKEREENKGRCADSLSVLNVSVSSLVRREKERCGYRSVMRVHQSDHTMKYRRKKKERERDKCFNVSSLLFSSLLKDKIKNFSQLFCMLITTYMAGVQGEKRQKKEENGGEQPKREEESAAPISLLLSSLSLSLCLF